jgi:UDP-N-acetyl-D-galactosamine dehydrogenase
MAEFGIKILNEMPTSQKYDTIVLAVAHDQFQKLDFEKYHKEDTVLFDVKSVVDRQWVDSRL